MDSCVLVLVHRTSIVPLFCVDKNNSVSVVSALNSNPMDSNILRLSTHRMSELGSFIIEVGFGGESRPCRVVNSVTWETDDGSWHISINDGSEHIRATGANSFITYHRTGVPLTVQIPIHTATVMNGNRVSTCLLSHILTYVLFVQQHPPAILS